MTLRTKPLLIITTLVVTLVAIAACGSESISEPEITATPTTISSSECREVKFYIRDTIVRQINNPEIGLRAFQMAVGKSPRTKTRWLIAADIEGPGMEGDGPFALFSIPGEDEERPFASDLLQAFNEDALTYTDIYSSLREIKYGAFEGIFEGIHNLYASDIERSISCAIKELNENPETTVHSN